jgi:hypothetical protein|nr:MAG TPA: hypothetical protein [Caudoviricetes sp.]
MLEELCRNSFYTACCKEKNLDGLVYLKGHPKPERPLKDFQIDNYLRQDWGFIPINLFCGRGRWIKSTRRMAWVWFNEHENQIRDAYLEKKYGGDIKLAMISTGNFITLFDEFKGYFAERKKVFMKKAEQAMTIQKAELSKRSKSPQSHGGVANLLKVLTKTMQEQGSSIYSIAKVQYAVCMQAGIYIPDEFLTDVFVAQEIMDGGADRDT